MQNLVKDLINKLQKNKYKVFKILDREKLEIINADEKSFEFAQNGFRDDKNIKDWKTMVGENFYVIGFETSLGDPIIADVGTEGFPVYYMMHDDWSSLGKVANTFDELIENLKAIDNIINSKQATRFSIRKFVKQLDKNIGGYYFYEYLCYDILNRYGYYYKDFKAK